MTLKEFKEQYSDTPEHHKKISDLFIEETNSIPKLKELRDFVESHVFGFGEREFYYMHKIIVESFEKKVLNFLEIGVFRGQTLALYRILEKLCDKKIIITGITPLDSTDGHWESDYLKDITLLHQTFNLKQPKIIEGLSTDQMIIDDCQKLKLDILYIDGGHTKEVVHSDIINYSPLVVEGGYLIIDDSANNLHGCYNGRFWGIKDVSDTVDSLLPPSKENKEWLYIGNIIHNRIWKRNQL
jgi:hypothetical protein